MDLKEKAWAKKLQKPYVMLKWFPVYCTEKNNPIHFAAKELDFNKLVYTPNAHTVVIKLDGKSFNAILQDIQFHPVSDRILHVDFYELKDDKEISMNIPVTIQGAAPGVLNSGGTLSLNKRKLRVRAIPSNLPDTIVADISGLELGNKLTTSDLKNDAYSFLHPETTVVCQVRTSRASIKDVAEALEETEESAETEETETEATE